MNSIVKKLILLIFIFFIGASFFAPVFAQENYKLEISFFYSETCSHCYAENEFLNGIQEKYPEVKINRYVSSDSKSKKVLTELASEYGVERYIGLVPLTFVGDEFFPGFDNENGIGKKIEDSIKRQLENPSSDSKKDENLNLPIIGEINIQKYSLLGQAIILGFFDGFNVCSLGALVLILGLVLILRSRSKIFIFGGIFIATTAIVYGLLIVLWYQIFYYLASVLKIMNFIVGFLGIAGGIYFLKEFVRFRKQGPTCDVNAGNSLIAKFSQKLKTSFKESGGIWGIVISIFVFAVLITIVEFPCSAVVPVFFASTLASAGLSVFQYLFYIAIFVLFYMLDEIIVFLIAIFTMNIKIASSKAIVWITLLEAIVLFLFGFYYLIGF